DITKINTQGIVLFANNNYKYSKNICENLYSSNLMKLDDYDKSEIRKKKSGEIYLTNSYDNIHKYILHIILPKYNSKFILATHNTMNLCIQEILYICYEKKIESLSIPIVFFNLFFPINIFLITLLKSLRSLLLVPQFSNTIKSIIFVTNSNDIYFLLLKYVTIFFPRYKHEMYLSTNVAVLGNKFGVIDVQNRSIPIIKSLRCLRRVKMKKKRRKHKTTRTAPTTTSTIKKSDQPHGYDKASPMQYIHDEGRNSDSSNSSNSNNSSRLNESSDTSGYTKLTKSSSSFSCSSASEIFK
ncbi:conserved protein, unknown function, partial [Hepatocystis sp. ex Piliocolobus tephrosceles]